MKKAIAYGRYSPRPKAKEETCDSIRVQKDAIKWYCESNQIEVSKIYCDLATSAGIGFASRSAGAEVLLKLRIDGIKVLVVQRLDRMFRDVADGLETLMRFDKDGIELHLAQQGGCTVNCATATGKLIATMLLAQGAFERDMVKERTSEAMKSHQGNGRIMGRRDRLPYGWKVDPNDPDRMVESTTEQATATYIKKLRGEGMTIGRITKALIAKGIPPRGELWYPSTVRAISRS